VIFQVNFNAAAAAAAAMGIPPFHQAKTNAPHY
jgi:hypothetical protein